MLGTQALIKLMASMLLSITCIGHTQLLLWLLSGIRGYPTSDSVVLMGHSDIGDFTMWSGVMLLDR